MKKKLLIFMLVLGMASVSQAAWTAFVIDGSQEYDATGMEGMTVRIDVIADTAWSGAVIGGIVEASAVNGDNQAYAADVVNMGGAVGSQVIYTSAAVNIIESGYQINYEGNLAVTMSAATTAGALSPGTVAISFDYTLPSTLSSDYWVAPLKDGEPFIYAEGQSFDVAASYSALGEAGNVPIEGVHIIPEPMTVLLLGLGGLLLRRRK